MPKDSIIAGSKTIEDCEQKVRKFIKKDYSYKLYDLSPPSNPTRLVQSDLFILMSIGGGNPGGEKLLELWNKRHEIDDILENIPDDIALTDEESSIPWDDLKNIFTLFFSIKQKTNKGMRRALGIARSSKILHKKRPLLIPLMDNQLIPKFYGSIAYPSNSREAISLIKEIRKDIINNQNTLKGIKSKLKKQEPSIANISILRIFDIILCGEVWPSGN
jgi:hypothetical protein